MDNSTKEFIDYLFYIGLISTDSISNFISNLKNISQTTGSHRELLAFTLKDYISSLNPQKLTELSFNILSKFFENKFKANTNILLHLYTIYRKFSQNKLSYYYRKWYRIISKNERQLYTYSPNFNTSPNERSDYYKNRNNFSHNNNYKNYNRYSNYNMNNNNQQTKKNTSYTKTTNSYLTSSLSNNFSNSFYKRLDGYSQQKIKNKDKLLRSNENEYNLLCTFSPFINNSKSVSNINKKVYNRLYEDSYKRKINYNKKVNDYINYIKNESNLVFSSESRTLDNMTNNNAYTVNNDQREYRRKAFDKNVIENLYKDYKKRKNKNKLLMEKIDIDDGCTFKPRICKSVHFKSKI